MKMFKTDFSNKFKSKKKKYANKHRKPAACREGDLVGIHLEENAF